MKTLSNGYPCRILEGDRISIPKIIMKNLGLKQGDLMLVRYSKRNLIMTPCKVVEMEVDVK